MTVLEGISLEMERLGLDNATGINVCELIDKHNIEVCLDHQLLVDTWRELNKTP